MKGSSRLQLNLFSEIFPDAIYTSWEDNVTVGKFLRGNYQGLVGKLLQ